MFRCQECNWSSNSGREAFKHESVHPLQVHCYEDKWRVSAKWKSWSDELKKLDAEKQEARKKKLQQTMIEVEAFSKQMEAWKQQAARKTVSPYYRPSGPSLQDWKENALRKLAAKQEAYRKFYGSFQGFSSQTEPPKPEPQVQEEEISIAVRPKRKFNLTE